MNENQGPTRSVSAPTPPPALEADWPGTSGMRAVCVERLGMLQPPAGTFSWGSHTAAAGPQKVSLKRRRKRPQSGRRCEHSESVCALRVCEFFLLASYIF